MRIGKFFQQSVYHKLVDLFKPLGAVKTGLITFWVKCMLLPVFFIPVGGAFAEKPSFYINLQNYPLYLKAGFDPPDTVAPDVQDGSWRVYKRWTHVIISKMNLPGNPKRTFLSPFGKPPQEWTFVIPFRMEEEAPPFPGVFLAAIGENWEVYLNGTLVRKEMHLDSTGRIGEHHSQREVFFPLNSTLLRPGENLLVFHIVGDPTDQTVGFQYSAPYYLGDYEYITRKNSEILRFILIGVYLLVGVYHFLIFAVHRESRYNGFCGTFALLMGLYYLTRTHGIYQLIPNTLVVVKLEFFFIFLVIPALVFFTGLLGRGRVPGSAKIYNGFCAFLAVSQLLFPHPYGSDALIVWQVMGILAMLWLFVYNILLPFAGEVKKGRRIKAVIWDTYPGNMLVAVGILALSVIVDLVDALILHYSIGFTHYSMVVFVLSLAVMLARLYGKETSRPGLAPVVAVDSAEAWEGIFREQNLTPREAEVARLMLEGLSNREIADRIFRSKATVDYHITNIYRKFGIDDKTSGRAAFMALFIKSYD